MKFYIQAKANLRNISNQTANELLDSGRLNTGNLNFLQSLTKTKNPQPVLFEEWCASVMLDNCEHFKDKDINRILSYIMQEMIVSYDEKINKMSKKQLLKIINSQLDGLVATDIISFGLNTKLTFEGDNFTILPISVEVKNEDTPPIMGN